MNSFGRPIKMTPDSDGVWTAVKELEKDRPDISNVFEALVKVNTFPVVQKPAMAYIPPAPHTPPMPYIPPMPKKVSKIVARPIVDTSLSEPVLTSHPDPFRERTANSKVTVRPETKPQQQAAPEEHFYAD